MRLEQSKKFTRRLADLTDAQADGARKALKQFVADSHHPSLNFEKVKGTDYCTIRCNQGDRLVLKRTGSQVYVIVDVGSHDYIYRKYS